MTSRRGFTIVELLVAGAILVILMGSLGGLLVNSLRAYEANRAASADSGQLRSAIQALQYDLSMAGFVGTDVDAADRSIVTPIELATSDCSPTFGCRIDSIIVRYYESRYASSVASYQEVRYVLGGGDLVREVNGTEMPVADGITGFRLLTYERRSGSTSPASGALPGDLAGLDLRLTLREGDRVAEEDFSVTVLNPH